MVLDGDHSVLSLFIMVFGGLTFPSTPKFSVTFIYEVLNCSQPILFLSVVTGKIRDSWHKIHRLRNCDLGVLFEMFFFFGSVFSFSIDSRFNNLGSSEIVWLCHKPPFPPNMTQNSFLYRTFVSDESFTHRRCQSERPGPRTGTWVTHTSEPGQDPPIIVGTVEPHHTPNLFTYVHFVNLVSQP